MNTTEIEQLRAEVKDLNERVMWLEGALELIALKLDRHVSRLRDPRYPSMGNLWDLARLGRELNREMNDN